MRALLLLTLTVITACTTSGGGSGGGHGGSGAGAAGNGALRDDAGATMVRSAAAMLGQPYRYGGEKPGGFDCSGLMVYAAARAGLRIPRTAHEQLHAGRAVSRRAIRAGDLVFMRLAGKELHVGMAIDGGHFVHAPSSGGVVRVDSLGAAPYARGYLEARRILPEDGLHTAAAARAR